MISYGVIGGMMLGAVLTFAVGDVAKERIRFNSGDLEERLLINKQEFKNISVFDEYLSDTLGVDVVGTKNQINALSQSQQSSVVKVRSQGLKDYITQIVRIESVHDEKGQEIYKRSLIGKYLKAYTFDRPGKYSLTLLCERPYLLEFKHPKLEIEIEAGKEYLLTCFRSDGEVKASSKLISKS